MDIELIDSGEKGSFEFSEYVMKCYNNKLRICIIYRPTYSPTHRISVQQFLHEFTRYLETVILSLEPLLICGDFNIHVDVANNHDAITFLDILGSSF